jgi:hypothetical protein
MNMSASKISDHRDTREQAILRNERAIQLCKKWLAANNTSHDGFIEQHSLVVSRPSFSKWLLGDIFPEQEGDAATVILEAVERYCVTLSIISEAHIEPIDHRDPAARWYWRHMKRLLYMDATFPSPSGLASCEDFACEALAMDVEFRSRSVPNAAMAYMNQIDQWIPMQTVSKNELDKAGAAILKLATVGQEPTTPTRRRHKIDGYCGISLWHLGLHLNSSTLLSQGHALITSALSTVHILDDGHEFNALRAADCGFVAETADAVALSDTVINYASINPSTMEMVRKEFSAMCLPLLRKFWKTHRRKFFAKLFLVFLVVGGTVSGPVDVLHGESVQNDAVAKASVTCVVPSPPLIPQARDRSALALMNIERNRVFGKGSVT